MTTQYEYAIKHEVLNSGTEIFIPVVRPKQKVFKSSWSRITKVYDRYLIMDLDFNTNLTHEECEEHIAGHKEEVRVMNQNKIKKTSIIGIEEVRPDNVRSMFT